MLAVLTLAGLLAGAPQATPKAALAMDAGWSALSVGRADVAAEAFRQATEADPGNARAWLGAGMAAALQRRDEDARTALLRALTIDPTLARARALLGQVRYRTGDLAGAIREYEKLVADAPDDDMARVTLERWRREADLHDRMQQTFDAHFAIAFEGPAEAALADQALAALDRAYWRIGQLLETFPVDPIRVVLYTREQFRDITRSPGWAAGAYDGIIRVPIRGALDQPAELDRVLAHEFIHALVRTLAPRGVPVWLNEGIATALERSDGDLGWAERQVAATGAMPLRAMRSFGTLDAAHAHLAYATSALVARRMLQDGGGAAVTNLLRDLGEGVAFDRAFLHRFGRSFADFERELSY